MEKNAGTSTASTLTDKLRKLNIFTSYTLYTMFMDDLKAEDIIAIILLSGSFIALYLGKASWEQILSIITLIAGVYFGIGIGYKRASQKEGEKVV